MRTKLILVFISATLLPTAAILWASIALIEHSLSYAGTADLDSLSRSMQAIAREYYRISCEDLKKDVRAGRAAPEPITPGPAHANSLRRFQESRDPDRCELSEPDGSRMQYLVRNGSQILLYARELNGIRMEDLTRQYRRARAQVEQMQQKDLRKGLIYTLCLISSIVWIVALVLVVYITGRISRPITELTHGLHRLAGGDFGFTLNSIGKDEVGRAVEAFNNTAGQLQQNRDRLVYLTQIASWQTLARKMAHELKNSLTPIRLTVEEILARTPADNREFLEQAAHVVVSEIDSLERRVRAFSEFASEPAVHPAPIDILELLQERIRFLEVAHSDVQYLLKYNGSLPSAFADIDQVKGVVTNLLENAAEAAGSGGRVCAVVRAESGRLFIEVHDSGSGLSDEARRTLFEPSISFKKNGMGLGLSISRKNALLAGGDLASIPGLLGGAGFRLELPAESGTA